jgi:hypothetical protein
MEMSLRFPYQVEKHWSIVISLFIYGAGVEPGPLSLRPFIGLL